MSTPAYGLIGETLAHSQSPYIHSLLAPYAYGLFEVPPEGLSACIRQPHLRGLNVTIPYKQAVMPLCDALTPLAARIGSVNTLLYGADGRITGDNTDYAGLATMIDSMPLSFENQKVLILGTGGSAQTARMLARDRGAREALLISRTGGLTYDMLPRHADATLLINATPVGMFPHADGIPVNLSIFDHLQGVVDLVYNPLRTRLVLEAERRGIAATGGLPMLVHQAAHAAALFLGEAGPLTAAPQALRQAEKALANIVLVGMPGSGKSTVGRALSAQTGRELIDTDDEIEARAGKPIPRIFAEAGEAAFRALEAAVIDEAAQRQGVIIATGGGSVESCLNRGRLARNGSIVHLRRPLELLATGGRPLSADVSALAAWRMPVYAAMCDIAVDNDAAIETAATKIREALA